jgi:predicted nuclease of restriction endonuclease-like RecB superfamily
LFVAGPVFEEETIVHAEIDMEDRELAKAYYDSVGHYSRPDLLTLRIREEAWTQTGPTDIRAKIRRSERDEQFLKILKQYKVSPAELEAALRADLDEERRDPETLSGPNQPG